VDSPDTAEPTPEHQKVAARLEPADRKEWLNAARRSGWDARQFREALREAARLAWPDPKKLVEKIRRATADREEADREWRKLIRAADGVLTLEAAAEAASLSKTHVWRIQQGTDRRGEERR